MAGFFKNIASGINDIVYAAQATISPFKVQSVSQDKFKGYILLRQDGWFTLYGKSSTYECVGCKPDTSKLISIFRQNNETESFVLYKSVLQVMMPIVSNGNVNFQEDILQKILDCMRENPLWTCAHVAAYLGFYTCLKQEGISCLVDNASEGGNMMTPLMAALLGKQAQAAEELLRLGANIGKKDRDGNTAYHYCVLHCAPLVALLTDFDKQGVINWLNGKGESALLLACHRRLSDATEMLIESGADPRIATADCLPIHAAVKACDLKSVEAIVKAFPDQVNAKDFKYGGSPLHWAENIDCIQKLALLNCNMDLINKEGLAPLHVMMLKKRPECLMCLLCHGANCNLLNMNGKSVLHLAIEQDNLDLVRQFVVFGADVNQLDVNGNTPRHLAAITKGKHNESFFFKQSKPLGDTILYLLHVSGAKRCSKTSKGCMAGCMYEGNFNGTPDQTMASLMTLDSAALFDEQLSATFVSSRPTQKAQGAVLDMIDSPTCHGDRVLCLDGGGIRGLVLIQILIEIEAAVGRPIKECFDWIGGTSTGGILALGIARGYSLKYMKGMYVRLKDEVFKGSRPYDVSFFEDMLKREFGEDLVMSDIDHPKILIPAIIADRFPADVHFFRNFEPTLNRPDEAPSGSSTKISKPHEQKVWEAARSTGAAPTYFRGYGPFLDGGLVGNNPTLDVLTEIHQYNTGLRLTGRAHEARPVGCVISLGCGRIPTTSVQNTDVFVPWGITDIYKAVSGASALGKLIVDQATLSEGRPVDRARAWCSMIQAPFYRFSPQLSKDISLDCHEEQTLINMMWETHCYMVANRHRLQELSSLLKPNEESC